MNNNRVLIVEDEEDILELIGYNLRREGFEVNGASTGEKGLTSARNSFEQSPLTT